MSAKKRIAFKILPNLSFAGSPDEKEKSKSHVQATVVSSSVLRRPIDRRGDFYEILFTLFFSSVLWLFLVFGTQSCKPCR